MTLNFKSVALFAVLLLALLFTIWVNMLPGALDGAAVPLQRAVATVLPAEAIQSSEHASNKHGWLLTQSIMDCISKNGPYMQMKFRDRNGKFYIPCQLPDGSIGLGIFNPDGSNASAYIPRDGSWEQVKQYILQRASRFTGPLPF